MFRDPMSATSADPDHSATEDRHITLGYSIRARLLIVSHTEEFDVIRIFSARMASKPERSLYEENG